MVETEDHLVLRADLPGLSRKDVEIEIKDGVLGVRIPKPEQRKPRRVAIGSASVNGSAAESTED